MVTDSIDIILKKLGSEGKLEILSDSEKVINNINYHMNIVRIDYRKKEAESWIDAGKIYITN